MHLCTCVSEEGGDGEAARSETPSLLSNTLRCVSFAECVFFFLNHFFFFFFCFFDNSWFLNGQRGC
jgi:hypothetical protein